MYLGSIVEELMRTFKENGEDYYIHNDHIKCQIQDLFPNSEEVYDVEKGYPFYIIFECCLKLFD